MWNHYDYRLNLIINLKITQKNITSQMPKIYGVYVKDIFYYMLNSINTQVNKDIYIHIYIYT